MDAKKCLLTGAWYSCLLRGSASAWKIQRRMLAANHWTEHRVPNGGVRERTEGAEGVCNPIGRTTISTNQTPQNSQGLSHQQRSTHDSSCICSREWPNLASVGGEVLGSVNAWCLNVGECHGGNLEWVDGRVGCRREVYRSEHKEVRRGLAVDSHTYV